MATSTTNRDATERTYRTYHTELNEHDLLSKSAERALAERTAAGDEDARKHLARANLRLVVKIARRYQQTGVPLLDLIQVGNVGLLRGIDKYRLDKGACISTYVSWWIRAEIMALVRNVVRPYKIGTTQPARHVIGRFRNAESRLRALHGEDGVTNEMLAEEIGSTPETVAHVRMSLQPALPLDAPMSDCASDASPRTYSELLMDMSPDPEAAAMHGESVDRLRSTVRSALSVARLDPRERLILDRRVMADEDDAMTLQEIADMLGVSRERVRQLQNRALKKLAPLLSSVAEGDMAFVPTEETVVPGTIPGRPLAAH